jgi:nucleotide-binding universal stress UspA family protein
MRPVRAAHSFINASDGIAVHVRPLPPVASAERQRACLASPVTAAAEIARGRARSRRAGGVGLGTSHARGSSMGFTKIVCPVDFSPCSREALRVAAELARDASAPLVLAHVWEPPRWATGEIQLAPGIVQDLVDAEEAELARWKVTARQLGAREVAVRFLTGVPWDEIVTLAQSDPGIDLVVMGTHGRTGIKHVLLGSVAEKVVRHAPCAVLVVRARAGSD